MLYSHVFRVDHPKTVNYEYYRFARVRVDRSIGVPHVRAYLDDG
jgi:hypothetical protein